MLALEVLGNAAQYAVKFVGVEEASDLRMKVDAELAEFLGRRDLCPDCSSQFLELLDKLSSSVARFGVGSETVGVRHPSRPGSYLLAVECDGATYHQAAFIRSIQRIRNMSAPTRRCVSFMLNSLPRRALSFFGSRRTAQHGRTA